MTDDDFQMLLDQMQSKYRQQNEGGAQGDYQDFLAAYMNAMNQGVGPNQLREMGAIIPQDRRQGIKEFSGALDVQRDNDPHIRGARTSIDDMLKSFGDK